MSSKRIEDDGPDVQGVSVAQTDGGLAGRVAPTGFCARCRLETWSTWQTHGEPPAPWCPVHGIFLSEPQPQPSISVHAHEVVPRPLSETTDDRFASLRQEMDAAFAQAASGKGMERHGDGGRFEDQTTIRMARELGTAFPVGQAVKKLIEGERMMKAGNFTGALREWHGAMVYAAMACIVGRRS